MSSTPCYFFLIAASVISAQAAPITFFGEDLNGNPNARIAFPNATAARASFVAQTSGSATDSLEEFPGGMLLPLTLTFGSSQRGTLSGSTGSINSLVTGTDGFGRFPTSGTHFLESDAASLTLAFNTPLTAFGFYGTDIGDFGAQLSLLITFPGGTTSTVTVPHSLGTGTASPQDGSVLFFGYINKTSPFTSVQFLDSANSDTFGFDDPIAAGLAVIVGPEPMPAALLGTGLLIIGLLRNNRKFEDS